LITDVNESGAQSVASSLNAGDKVAVMKMDVTQESHWHEAVKKVVDTWGKLDILVLATDSRCEVFERADYCQVNNAGTTYRNKPTLEVTSDDFDRVFMVNVKSIFLSVQAVVPQMKNNQGGSIINISSIGSVRPRPGLVW
jgi:NAD(P)-dependent dehydrogenase (short-subunit alcohol dehydrogenase family)